MKEGHRFVDCDMHIMEPIDLFDSYLDPAFKDRVTSSQRRVDGGSTGMRGRPLWFFDGAPTQQRRQRLAVQPHPRAARLRPRPTRT